MRVLIILTIIFGLLTLFGIFGSFLALSDIHRNTEPNLDGEWVMVQVSMIITTVFTILALFTVLLQAMRSPNKTEAQD